MGSLIAEGTEGNHSDYPLDSCTISRLTLKILPGLTPKEALEVTEFLQTLFALRNSNLRCKNNVLVPAILGI